MRVEFVSRDKGPERLICEAEIVFETGELSGMRLVGFSVWRSPDGSAFVTFPSRAFGAGNDRKYFDYLRSVDGTAEPVRRVKSWILESYRAQGEPAA